MQLSNDKGKDHAKVSNELSHYLLFNYTLSLNKLKQIISYITQYTIKFMYIFYRLKYRIYIYMQLYYMLKSNFKIQCVMMPENLY